MNFILKLHIILRYVYKCLYIKCVIFGKHNSSISSKALRSKNIDQSQIFDIKHKEVASLSKAVLEAAKGQKIIQTESEHPNIKYKN